MKKVILLVLIFLTLYPIYAQNKNAYHIFNSKGKKISYQKMIQSIQKSDILLFGELHNNPITHWLQYEVSVDLLTFGSLTFGAEMFEADNQKELNLYLTDSISYKTLDSLARLWTNYKTDYAPLVNLAKKYKQKFVATNIPRRYANLVYKEGFDSLDSLRTEEKKWNSELTYITISTVSQSSVEKLDDMNKGKADFIICVDENMTTTY